MGRKRGPILITCQNPDCAYFLFEDGKNVTKMVTSLQEIINTFVIIVADFFFEIKNTSLYHSRLPRSEVLLIAKHSMEKTSIRIVSRVLDHHGDTISKYYHLIGQHAEILNNHIIRDISAGDCEFDEIWSFIQKKNKNLHR